ncbi:MAG: minor capsid protein, partial [Oscillospiraceae bacterium]|nr:minor capsid protein [Oscillospiraceae bacterium]
MVKRSKKYWEERAAALMSAAQEDADAAAERIIEKYENAIEDVNAEIQQIVKNFESYTGLDSEEAKKAITAAQTDEDIERLYALYEAAEDGTAAKDEIALRINARAYGARINTQELIKDTIYTAIKSVSIESKAIQAELYAKVYKSAYYTSIYEAAKGANMGISFSVIPQRAVEAALNEKWAGKNYSERIWGRSDDFVTAVEETVTNGLITGKSMDKRAQMLADRLGAEVDYNVKRLVRTETAHFTNQGQLKAYEAAGFEEYRYLAALSSATCEVCADLDGKIFKVYDAREGENYPPIHPNCRCTTVIADFTSG